MYNVQEYHSNIACIVKYKKPRYYVGVDKEITVVTI